MTSLLAPRQPGSERISAILPTITCSSCSASISLNDLGDHVCSSSGGGGEGLMIPPVSSSSGNGYGSSNGGNGGGYSSGQHQSREPRARERTRTDEIPPVRPRIDTGYGKNGGGSYTNNNGNGNNSYNNQQQQQRPPQPSSSMPIRPMGAPPQQQQQQRPSMGYHSNTAPPGSLGMMKQPSQGGGFQPGQVINLGMTTSSTGGGTGTNGAGGGSGMAGVGRRAFQPSQNSRLSPGPGQIIAPPWVSGPNGSYNGSNGGSSGGSSSPIERGPPTPPFAAMGKPPSPAMNQSQPYFIASHAMREKEDGERRMREQQHQQQRPIPQQQQQRPPNSQQQQQRPTLQQQQRPPNPQQMQMQQQQQQKQMQMQQQQQQQQAMIRRGKDDAERAKKEKEENDKRARDRNSRERRERDEAARREQERQRPQQQPSYSRPPPPNSNSREDAPTLKIYTRPTATTQEYPSSAPRQLEPTNQSRSGSDPAVQSLAASSRLPFFDKYKKMVDTSSGTLTRTISNQSDNREKDFLVESPLEITNKGFISEDDSSRYTEDDDDNDDSALPWARPSLEDQIRSKPKHRPQDSSGHLRSVPEFGSDSSIGSSEADRTRLGETALLTPSVSMDRMTELLGSRNKTPTRKESGDTTTPRASKGSNRTTVKNGGQTRSSPSKSSRGDYMDHMLEIKTGSDSGDEEDDGDQIRFSATLTPITQSPLLGSDSEGRNSFSDSLVGPNDSVSLVAGATTTRAPTLKGVDYNKTKGARGPAKICQRCGDNLKGKKYIEKEGIRLCVKDWKEMFLPKCRRCELPIETSAVSSSDGQLKGKYHKHCFSCYECNEPFNGTFYVWEDKPYCAKHYHERNNTICHTCGKGIEGRCLISNNSERYHPSCLKCEHRYPSSQGGRERHCSNDMSDYWQVGKMRVCDEHVEEAKVVLSRMLARMEMEEMERDRRNGGGGGGGGQRQQGHVRSGARGHEVRAERRKTKLM